MKAITKVTKAQLQKIHILLNQQGLKEEKAAIISNLTDGRSQSSKELSASEARHLIEWLCKTDPNDAMKKKVFDLAYEIGMIWGDTSEDKKMNAAAVSLTPLTISITSRAMAASNTAGSRATVQQLLQQMPQWKDITSPGSHKVLSLIERCRTADLGYHAYRCTDSDCGAMQYVYHSCRNPPLPSVRQQQKRRVDRSTDERTVAGKILSCSLYHAPSVKQSCIGQPQSDVQPALRCCFIHIIKVCRR